MDVSNRAYILLRGGPLGGSRASDGGVVERSESLSSVSVDVRNQAHIPLRRGGALGGSRASDGGVLRPKLNVERCNPYVTAPVSLRYDRILNNTLCRNLNFKPLGASYRTFSHEQARALSNPEHNSEPSHIMPSPAQRLFLPDPDSPILPFWSLPEDSGTPPTNIPNPLTPTDCGKSKGKPSYHSLLL